MIDLAKKYTFSCDPCRVICTDLDNGEYRVVIARKLGLNPNEVVSVCKESDLVEVKPVKEPGLVDIAELNYLHIQLGDAGQVWLNDDTRCRLRIGRVTRIDVEDNRPKTSQAAEGMGGARQFYAADKECMEVKPEQVAPVIPDGWYLITSLAVEPGDGRLIEIFTVNDVQFRHDVGSPTCYELTAEWVSHRKPVRVEDTGSVAPVPDNKGRLALLHRCEEVVLDLPALDVRQCHDYAATMDMDDRPNFDGRTRVVAWLQRVEELRRSIGAEHYG